MVPRAVPSLIQGSCPRAGPQLKEATNAAVDDLLLAGRIGEGSTGIRSRMPAEDSPPGPPDSTIES